MYISLVSSVYYKVNSGIQNYVKLLKLISTVCYVKFSLLL